MHGPEKYYVFHCVVTEIDVLENTVNNVFEEHTEDAKVHRSEYEAINYLRDVLDKHSIKPLQKEIERLNRIIAALDQRLADAVTVHL